MMPASPRSHLILRQARFALGSPKAFFHPMFRIEHASKFPQRRLERRVRQSVIVFHDFATLPFAEDHQRFFGTVATPSLRLHANLDRFNGQGAFFARPNLDARPLLRRFHPAVRTLKRNFRRRSRTAVGRRNSVQIAHQRVGRNGQQIPLVHGAQFVAKAAVSAHFVVAGHPGVRQRLAMLPNHLQGKLMPCAKLDFPGIPACRQRRLSFVHSLGKYNLASTNACSS